MTLEEAEKRAESLSLKHGDRRYVIQIDSDDMDERICRVCDEQYLDCDEFEAYAGEVLEGYYDGELFF
jgi:hypothetical protein